MSEKIRVLIVDDSPMARMCISASLSTDEEIVVVGEAENGRDAIEQVKRLKPDIVTMDIVMPVMDGLTAIEKIMAERPVPIVVISHREDSKSALAAISRGAMEIISKADIDTENPAEFVSMIKLLSKVKVITHLSGKGDRKVETKVETKEQKPEFDKVIAIASSTGGPKALSIILNELPEKITSPVVIAQHMADGFISGLVKWLNDVSKLPVKEGVDGERILAGTAYISPSEGHMRVNNGKKIELIKRQPADIYHPSCNILLSSVADTFGANSVGIILTGMGDDGVMGMKKIKEAGGSTIAQDENTSAIFGMPKVAIANRCIDKVLPLEEISREIVRMVSAV